MKNVLKSQSRYSFGVSRLWSDKLYYVLMLFVMFIFSITFYSCFKDVDYSFNKDTDLIQNRSGNGEEIVINSKEEATQTVLGSQIINNPFDINNVTNAWNTLYPDNQIQSLEATDIYIRFEPENLAQAEELLQRTDLEVFNYPLDYKFVHLGEKFYQERNSEIPYFYALVNSGFNLPNIPHTILQEFYYDMTNPFLIVLSFYQTGHILEADKYFPSINPVNIPALVILPKEPNEPCPSGCVRILIVDDSGPNKYKWDCDCNVDPGGNPSFTTSDCGCQVYSDNKKPGGCINVQTNTSTWSPTFEGVRKAKVILRDDYLDFIYSPYVT